MAQVVHFFSYVWYIIEYVVGCVDLCWYPIIARRMPKIYLQSRVSPHWRIWPKMPIVISDVKKLVNAGRNVVSRERRPWKRRQWRVGCCVVWWWWWWWQWRVGCCVVWWWWWWWQWRVGCCVVWWWWWWWQWRVGCCVVSDPLRTMITWIVVMLCHCDAIQKDKWL